jgi:hypothetical protein
MRVLKMTHPPGRDKCSMATYTLDLVRDYCEYLNHVKWNTLASLSSI